MLVDGVQRGIESLVGAYQRYRLSARQLTLFRDAVARIKHGGVDVALFVPPLREYELELTRQTGHWDTFQQWKRQLLAAAPYWDFSVYDALACADRFSSDAVHFSPAVGNTILRLVLGEGCARRGEEAQRIVQAAAWVDARTVDRHLAAQDAERIARTREATRYSRAVEDAIRSHQISVGEPGR